MSAKLNELKRHLRPGQVYRRSDLAKWSNAVDRHIKQLREEGTLTKLSGGLYCCPQKTSFGPVPPEDGKMVEAFLKDRRFLLTSMNLYNALELGTTQLYNETLVYNHKRHGRFKLGGRTFTFRVKPCFPKTLSKAYLLVDMVNNINRLAEDEARLLERVRRKALGMVDAKVLSRMVRDYGTVRTKKFFKGILEGEADHAA